MKKKQKNLIGENQRTVLQPVRFSDDGEKSRAILIPEEDSLNELATKVNAIIQNMIDNGVIEYFTLKHSGGIVG